MKARVKATGEIVEVSQGIYFPYQYVDNNGTIYTEEHLEILQNDSSVIFTDPTIDYWTRLEHQYAGMAMQGILSNQDYCKLLIDENNKGSFAEDVSRCASDFAHALVEKMKEADRPMKGLFIQGIDAELRQSLIDCGFEPVKQDVYFNGTMVTSDGKLWHPSAPFKPWNPDGKGWPECKMFNNTNDFLTTAKEMLKEERK